MIKVRLGEELDLSQIRETFIAVYGRDYPYKEFYDETWLKRSLYNEQVLMLISFHHLPLALQLLEQLQLKE